MLREITRPDTWIIPSIGPDFGKLIDQATVLRYRPFPTAMVLPAAAAFTTAGVEAGIARAAERLGKTVIIYVRAEEHTSQLKSLMRISYAVFFLKNKNYPQLPPNQ